MLPLSHNMYTQRYRHHMFIVAVVANLLAPGRRYATCVQVGGRSRHPPHCNAKPFPPQADPALARNGILRHVAFDACSASTSLRALVSTHNFHERIAATQRANADCNVGRWHAGVWAPRTSTIEARSRKCCCESKFVSDLFFASKLGLGQAHPARATPMRRGSHGRMDGRAAVRS